MSTISDAILTAVDTVVREALTTLEYDKTITAVVYSVEDLDSGTYKVQYNGNIFYAYSSDLSTTYSVNDNVYVTVPEGDFSNRKIITCLASSSSLTYAEMLSLTNSISATSPTFDVLYGYDAASEYGVVAGAPSDSHLSYAVIYEGDEDNEANELFTKYANLNSVILIKADFMTKFHAEHNVGNYGLEIEFFTINGDTAYYKLDLNSFLGDPYSLSVYSPQSALISITPGYLTGVSKITLFEEDFEYDSLPIYGELEDGSYGITGYNYNTTTANIFCTDIEIEFVEVVDLTSTSYYCDISTPQGSAFTSRVTSLDLVGRLIYQGDNIIDEDKCECYWFERDLSVVVGSADYNKNAGYGWKEVTTNDFNTLTVDIIEVTHEKYYKFVVIYNSNVTMSAEVTLYNLLSDYDFDIEQVTSGDTITLKIDDDSLVGDWYILYPDASYTNVAYKQNEIEISSLLLYTPVTFYCGIYDSSQTEIIGVRAHTMTNVESEDDITITYTGEDSFRYDSNGDVTIEDSEQERTLQVSIVWRDGVGTSYTVEWIGPDGLDVTGTRYSPENSMMENLWIDTNNIFHYTIRLKYKVNYTNNTITVRIVTIDGSTYSFLKEIQFLKDGDLGTNGTTYVTAVRPYNTTTGLKEAGLKPLIYNNNAWLNTLRLRCYVYKDGELINSDDDYELEYEWTAYNVTLMSTGEDDKMIVSGTSDIIDSAAPPYVKVQVTVDDGTNGKTYSIYCFYPIDVAIGFTEDEVELIDIDDIPSYIKYTSSGTNPSFYSNNITFYYNDIEYTELITSLTDNILLVYQSLADDLYYLKPASSFIFENNSIGMLDCIYTDSQYLYHPIIMYLDTYGNEAINGWDGTTLEINEEGGYILAPLIGAGTKDSFNRFTGVVMGVDSGQEMTGLYGYQEGVNTFGLMENGKAFFGASTGGGLIVIDGTSGVIYGGGETTTNILGNLTIVYGGDASNGMTITLANLDGDSDTSAIKIANGIFEVLYDGSLTATSADITGNINADSGTIGGSNGWIIEAYRIYTKKNGTYHIELNANPDETYAIWAGATSGSSAASNAFAVDSDGNLYASTGRFGGSSGWFLTSRLFYNADSSGIYTIGMASSGTTAYWAGGSSSMNLAANTIPTFSTSTDSDGTVTATATAKFIVTRQGKVYCNDAFIEGTIKATSGTIGGWTITSTSLRNSDNSVYLSASGGLKLGSNFSVTSSGSLTAKSGTIGGWTIGSTYLSAGSTTLSSSGSITCTNLTCSSGANITGSITATTLSCSNGTIGGWTISSSYLKGGSTYLYSDGSITCNNLTCNSGANITGSISATSLDVCRITVYTNTQFSNSLGTIGYVSGNDGTGTTTNIGISSSYGIVLTASSNIRLSPGGVVYLGSTYFQSGIDFAGHTIENFRINACYVYGTTLSLYAYIQDMIDDAISDLDTSSS